MNMLLQEEEFEQICSRESLMEKAAEIEKTIVVKKEHEGKRYDLDPTMLKSEARWHSDSQELSNSADCFYYCS